MQNLFKNKAALVIVLIILFAGIIYLWNVQKDKDQKAVEEAQHQQQNAEDQTATDTDTDTNTTTGSGSSTVMAYSAALKAYEGKRIQFDEYCSAIPKAVVFKSGTRIMLDNRSNDKRKIVLDGKVYNIAAFGYTTAVLPTVTTTNKTVTVDCADLVNVATITVQK